MYVFNQSEIMGLSGKPNEEHSVDCAMYEVQVKGHNMPSRELWSLRILP